MVGAGGWTVAVEVPADAVPAFATALESFGPAVSTFEASADGARWCVEVYAEALPDRGDLVAALALAAALAGVAEPEPVVVGLPKTDWLQVSRASFVPIRVGRYFIHPSHFEGSPPVGSIPITLDAGLAFGTGAHASTSGCLAAFGWLARRAGFRPRRMLDLGCGSGVLSIAMARTWRAPVVAADVDPVAVRVAAANVRCNGVHALVRTHLSDGIRHAAVRRPAPYDLIVANIQTRPLVEMAPGLSRCLGTDGVVVLSGILAEEEREVRAAYRRQKLHRVRKESPNGWCCLVLTP